MKNKDSISDGKFFTKTYLDDYDEELSYIVEKFGTIKPCTIVTGSLGKCVVPLEDYEITSMC